jgi:hypothetical protein
MARRKLMDSVHLSEEAAANTLILAPQLAMCSLK